MLREARWWHLCEGGRVACELCPRCCTLSEGQVGFCGVRLNQAGELRSAVSGVHSGLAVDPIEKKPLYHFLPGSRVLSFGTMGCNLACTYCQNWSISQDIHTTRFHSASAETIVNTAMREGCVSLAFTYNEPSISAEYAIEVAEGAHAAGLKTVAVTSGYIAGSAREMFFDHMDAANVDLKGFTEAFYRNYCNARLAPVLETLEWIAHEKRTWLEVTNLIIPGANDSPQEIQRMCAWMARHLGCDVPLHFSAFHSDYHLLDRGVTPISTLLEASRIAHHEGLNFVYLGNVQRVDGGITRCSNCHADLIQRSGFQIMSSHLMNGACHRCATTLPGIFT